MKIYFAASIRGGREDILLYQQIIGVLKEFGQVLTEHVGDAALSSEGENITDTDIYKRDLDWLTSSDVVVVEATTPSLGVGYELAKAEELGKPVLVLFRPGVRGSLSAMISGSPRSTVREYQQVETVTKIVADFLSGLSSK